MTQQMVRRRCRDWASRSHSQQAGLQINSFSRCRNVNDTFQSECLCFSLLPTKVCVCVCVAALDLLSETEGDDSAKDAVFSCYTVFDHNPKEP